MRVKDVPETPPVSPTAHLEERKAQIYENLRDLQFEFRLGKLSDADYQKTKVDLQRELAKVLAEIDAMKPLPCRRSSQGRQGSVRCQPSRSSRTEHLSSLRREVRPTMKFCGECGKAMA